MKSEEQKLFRLLDANLNRLREGLRVVEDIFRYIYDHEKIATSLKALRHQARYEDDRLLQYRDIASDVLKKSTQSERQRTDIQEIVTANMKRAQESARVLEEGLKLIDPEAAERFKRIRYTLYDLEINLQRTLRSRSDRK